MTNPLKIYSGSNALLYTTPVNIGCRRRVQLMNEDSITVKFSDKTKMKFPVGTRIGDFYITKEQQEKYNAATGGYDYELKFDAYYWLWANRLLFYVMPGVTNAPKETSFKLTATIDVHAAVILRCLNALGFTYDGSPFRVDTDAGFSIEAKYISYANMSILGGIQAIADAYECEWWVVGNAIHFGRCNDTGVFDFTVGENVASITSDSKETAPNRLIVFGSSRNLPPDYRTPESSNVVDAVVVKRLMLPEGTPYLQTAPDIPEDEIVEKEVVLDSVYPRTSLSVTEVTTYDSTTEGVTQTFYRVKYGTSFLFSKDYILPDEELHIVFESGDLNGMDFAVRFNPLGLAEKKDDGSFNPDAQMFEIVSNEDYGRSLPDAVLHPSKNDKFSLYGWDSTKMEALGLLAVAEQELLAEGNKLLDEYRKDKQTYTCPMMWDWCKEQAEEGNSPRLGSVVNLHFVAGDTGRKSRIIGFEHDLDIEYSNVAYICGEKVSVSRLKTLESKVEGLTHTGEKAKVQNSLDFLSKRYSDRTPYQLASDMGFDVGDFLAGASGGRFGKDVVTGQTFLEVDRIFARVRAYFESLTVIEAATLAGKHYVTPGGSIKCTKVEEVKDEAGDVTAYRCYFLSEQDGEKTETKIITGDQAISEMFNAKTGTANKVSNHRYWRLVTGVSNEAYTDDSGNRYGYVELSATDCESGSDIPKEGDVIEQFGNRTDRTRQSAIVFSTVDSDSPSIKLFTGIGSGETNAEHYSLDGRDIISQGYDSVKGHAYMKCYGDTYIGAPDGSTYIKYDIDENKTKVKADIEITSTIGGKSIDQYFGEKATEATDKYKYLAESLEKAAQDSTYIKGGLVLTTMIALGYTEGEARHILSGMNGSYNAELGGRTIASWYGGSMLDLFNPDGTRKTTAQLTGQEATSLIRMDGSYYFSNGNIGGRPDGSGWLAGDNITWDASGAITFGNGIKIDLGGGNNTTLGGISDSLSSVIGLVNTIGNHLIPTYLDGGVYKDTTWAAITNGTHTLAAIKTKEGFFSDKFISAKGASDTAGGAGATQLRMLTDVAINDGTLSAGQALVYNGSQWVNQTVAPGLDETSLAAYLTNNNYAKKSDIPSLSGYATETWVTNKGYITSADLTGYATESWVTGKGYITSAALAPYLSKDDAADLYQPKGNYLTEHQDIYALTLQAGTFSAKTYNPKTGAVKVNIPTTTSHISEGTNLYFTNARAIAALKTTTDTLQANIDKKLDTATFNTFKALFDSMFVKEADANSPEGFRIKAKFGLYSPYYLSAKGANPDGGASGYGLYTNWAQTPSSTDALGAVLGKSLYTKQNEHTTAISGLTSRVTALEGKNYLDSLEIAVTGTGNAVTSVSQSTDKKKLTFTKGSTFLTGITKAMVENVLTGNITSHTHSQYLTTTSASSTYLSKTDAGTTYLKKTDAASTYVAKEEGKGLSEKNFTTALLNKLNGIAEGANKYVLPVAKAAVLGGVMIGTSLSVTAAGLLDLPDKVAAGTYTKVTVDVKGRVTAGATLAAADIPTLAISKVSGLQDALNAKAAKSDFDTLKTWIESMFVKETDSNSPEGFRIKAKFGLYSPYYISAKGASDSSGAGGGGGYNRLDAWADYASDKAGYVLSAGLGYDLHTRLLNVYGKTTIDNKLAGIYTKTEADGRYVTALGTSGNSLTWTKNGTVNNITVPYASGAGKLTASTPTTLALTHRETSAYFGVGGNTVADKPTGVDAFGMLSLRTADGWQGQLLMASNTATGLYWRTAMTLNGGWRTVLDSVNYTTVLDSVYFKTASLKTLTIQKNGTQVGTFKPNSDATINITDVASASTLSSHTGNTTVHITAAERTKWNKVVTDFAAITGTDSDTIINKWEEVVAFLDTYTEADTLAGLLGNKADKATTITAGAGLTGGGSLAANRTLSLAASGVAAGTYFKTTVDTYGRVTSGSNPTTLSGFGITNAYTKTEADSKYVNLTGAQTITGEKKFTSKLIVSGDWTNDNGLFLYEHKDTTVYGGYVLYGKSDKLHFGTWNNSETGVDAMEIVRGSKDVTFLGKIVKSGGTSTQFLKADGSVDGTAYLPKSTFDTFKTLFDSMFEKVTTNGVTTIRAKFGLWTNEFLSAKGQSSDSGSGSGFGLYTSWNATPSSTDALGAVLGKGLHDDLSKLTTRVTSLEGGSALSVTTTGSGNAITAISKNGTVITATKGATFLTAHQTVTYIQNLGRASSANVATAGDKRMTILQSTSSMTTGKPMGDGFIMNFNCDTTGHWGAQLYLPGQDSLSPQFRRQNGAAWGTQPWVKLLSSENTKISNGVITINGTSITPLTSHQSLANYVTLNGAQTISGAKTFTGLLTIGTAGAGAPSATVEKNLVCLHPVAHSGGPWYINSQDTSTLAYLRILYKATQALRLRSNGELTAASFVKSGGTASQVLMADGSVQTHWKSAAVTSATSDVGMITPLAMNNWVSNNFYKKTDADSRFVNVSGDTMTGALQININNAVKHLGFGRAGYNYICATSSGGILGFVANGKAAGTAAYCDLIVENNAVHPGTTNVTTLGTSALRWSNVYATTLNVTSTSLVSNLNADLLDGFHKESFDGYRYTKIDASALDNNTWYPVVFRVPKAVQTRVRVEGGSAANASWNSRTDKQMAVFLDYTVQGGDYGWVTPQRVVNFIALGAGATGSNCVAGLGQLTNNSCEYVMVRGGAVYNFYISHWVVPELKTSTFTNNSQSIAPTTTSPAAITRNNARITDNVASATKLQTARTLWGQSFNGTANVDGAMTINYTGETGILLKRTEAGSGAFIRFCNNNQTANYFRMGMYGAGYFDIGYNGNHSIIISTANKVGINTLTPGYQLDVNGIIKSNNEIRTTAANGFRIAYGNYGFFIRNDGANTYFMMTNSGDANGSYNSLRPLYINDSTGRVTMDNGLTVNEAIVHTLKIGSVTITYDSNAKGLKISGGGLYSDSYISAKGASTASGGASAFGLYTNWAQTPLSTDALGAVLGKELYNNKLDKSAGVTALGTSGKYLTWTRNDSTNNLTVPYATASDHANTYLASLGRTTAISGTTKHGVGIRLYEAYNNGYPATYGNVLSAQGSAATGGSELLMQWQSNATAGHLYYRSIRDGGHGWSPWVTILDDDNYSSILDGRYYTETEVNTKLTNGSVTKVGTATVGGTAKPIYLNAGTPTALSATVGADNRPVYLKAGTITAGTYTFGNASGNAPISNGTVNTNLNADLLDGWHAGGQTGSVLKKSGYVTSATAGLSNYWVKLATIAAYNDSNDRDVTLYIHSAYDALYGVLALSARSSATSPGYAARMLEGNIPTDRIRLYRQSSTGTVYEVWVNVVRQYGVFNAKVISETGRTSAESGSIVTLYNTGFTAVQTPALTEYVTPTYLSLLNNASSASKLLTARTINGTSFDGSANITTASWGTARNIYIADSTAAHTGAAVSVNGSGNATLKLPATITAALSGNATTATTLQNARTLWGQSFNGGANVSGSLSSVGNITGSGAMTISSTNGRLTLNGAATALDLKFANTDAKSVILNGTAFKPYDAADNALELGTDAARWKKITACNMRLSSSTSGSGADVYAELWRGGAASWKMLNTGGVLKFQSNYTTAAGDYFDCMTLAYNTGNAYIKGSVGIGTTNPQHKLDVNGNIRANGWLRTTGATGWVNDTYGGGLCMTDATWVRIYGSKSFYQASGILRTDGTLQVGASGTYLNVASGGMTLGVNLDLKSGHAIHPSTDKTCQLGTTTRRWSRMYAAAVCIGSNGTETDEAALQNTTFVGGGHMELYRDTPFIDFHFGNSTKDYTSRIIEEASGRLAVIGTLRVSVGMYSEGYVSAKGQSTTSDERLKQVLRPVYLNVKDIAAAPSVEFVWKKDGVKDVGSIAQYWEKLMPQLVNVMPDGMKGLQYGKAALMGVIAVARKTESLESRVERLEKENRELKRELETIKRR